MPFALWFSSAAINVYWLFKWETRVVGLLVRISFPPRKNIGGADGKTFNTFYVVPPGKYLNCGFIITP